MTRLAEFFIDNPKVTSILVLFLIVFGALGFRRMNAESYPSVDFATVLIQTDYAGATPEDIEVKITKPIEDEIRKVSGIKDVRSTSQAGKSKIVVRIDMDRAGIVVKDVVSDLQRSVDRVQDLPADLIDKPKFTEMKSEEFPAIDLAIVGSNENRLRDRVADNLKDDFENSRLVKEGILEGFRHREFQIELIRNQLERYHIGVDEVLNKIANRNVTIPGGDLHTDKGNPLVKVDGKIRSADELRDITIRSNLSGQHVYLKDVANVFDGSEKAQNLTRYNGREATVISVTKKGGADTLALVEELQTILHHYKEQYKGQLEFHVYNDESNRVKQKLSTLNSNALSGLAVVFVVLFLFLPGRMGAMASLSLPIVLMATLGVMPLLGYTLNSITILALIIALGMLVDNSVVITEDYVRRRQLGETSRSALLGTVSQLWIPISATAFTTIAAFLPMLVTTGIMGRFISAIPVIVTTALLFCLVECFLLLPMRLHLVASNATIQPIDQATPWFSKLLKHFQILMTWIVDHRYITALLVTGLIGFSFVMIGVFNKFILFPAEQTEIYLARIDMKPSTPVEVTYEKTGELEQKIHQVLGTELIRDSVSWAGVQMTRPDDPRGQNSPSVGLVKIFATPFAKENVKHTEYLSKLRTIQLDGVQSLTFEEQINGPPVGAPVNVTFRSNHMEHLEEAIRHVQTELASMPGLVDVRIDDVIGPDEIRVIANYEKIDQLGLSARSVGETLRTALTGSPVSDVTLDNKEAKLRVQFADVSKRSIEDLSQVRIMDQIGNLIPLGKMAQLVTSPGTPQIKRFDFKRAKTLVAHIDDKVTTSVQANARVVESFEKIRSKYYDVSLVFGGEQESTNESLQSLQDAMVLALIGIFAIMVYIFRSYLRPLIIMTTIPLGLVGVSISFYLHQRPISFLAMIGVIGLAGVIVNNGIILIDYIETLRKEGKLSLRDVLIQAPMIRLRPVLVTSITTMGGLFPTAYGIGGADSMLIPMTLAMAWGLFTGTFLTVIWVPAAYGILEDIASVLRRVLKLKKGEPNAPLADSLGAT